MRKGRYLTVVADIHHKHLSTFDILKGIAIAMVILVHSRQKFNGLSPWLKIFDIGQMGCQMFFVIAGMTSMMSYERMQKNAHAGIKFYRKRLLAVVPGWYVSIFLIYILNTISLVFFGENIGFGTNREPLAIVCNLLLLHGLLPFCNNNVAGGGWFLGTLAIFWLVAPFCYQFLVKRSQFFVRIFPWLVEIIAVIYMIGLYVRTREKCGYAVLANNGFTYFSFVNQMGCFILGTSLYFEKETENIVRDKVLSVLYAFLLLLVFFSEWRLAFLLVPFIMGLLTCHLIRWMLVIEKYHEDVFEKNCIIRLLKTYGSSSFYVYLIHGLFVWSLPIAVQKFLFMHGIQINDNLLYLFLIVPMFILSYYAAQLLSKISGFLRNNLTKCF